MTTSPLDPVRDAIFGREVRKSLSQEGRVPAVDVFRGLAILTVVLYHGEILPYGYLGVDVFFVVSGLLIGRILVAKWDTPEPFRFPSFFAARAFKIWPSYYTMLFVGTGAAYLLYRVERPEMLITIEHWPRYLFFFQNYRGTPHPAFDHVWSLCVEEHFYVLLPVSMLVLRRITGQKIKPLFFLVGGAIALGMLGKLAGFRFGKETYSATHNRIDALAWGVLLAVLVRFKPELVKKAPRLPLVLAGVVIFFGALAFDVLAEKRGMPIGDFFHKVILFTLVPFSVFLAILGAYHTDPTKGPLRGLFWPVRFVAYYSYNWYLWHPVVGPYITKHLGSGVVGSIVYVTLTFALGVLFTVRVEEPALVLRNRVLGKAKPKA